MGIRSTWPIFGEKFRNHNFAMGRHPRCVGTISPTQLQPGSETIPIFGA